MTTKRKVERFFENNRFAKSVKLTKAEIKLLEDYEYKVYCIEGFRAISGGFALLELNEFDEENSRIILGVIKSGIQSDCENVVYTDNIEFNRATKVIRYI